VCAVVNSVMNWFLKAPVCAVVNSVMNWLIEGSSVCCCEQCNEVVN